jgi:hypothetical protein
MHRVWNSYRYFDVRVRIKQANHVLFMIGRKIIDIAANIKEIAYLISL